MMRKTFEVTILGVALGVALLFGCGDSHEAPRGDAGGTDGGSADGGGSDAGNADGGGADGYDACMQPGECVVVPASCCGSCGAATRGDAVAVNEAEQSDYRRSVCGDMVGCPACFMQQDPTLVATCEASTCQVVDLQMHEATACTAAGDCRVRTRDCCECGGDVTRGGLIAIRTDAEAAYSALVCDPGIGCPDCAPVYPPEARADCMEGRCVVVWDGG